jgi:hypothetical protein
LSCFSVRRLTPFEAAVLIDKTSPDIGWLNAGGLFNAKAQRFYGAKKTNSLRLCGFALKLRAIRVTRG